MRTLAALAVLSVLALIPDSTPVEPELPPIVAPRPQVGEAVPPPVGDGPPGVTLEVIAEGFREPVGAASPPDDPRIFVLERRGIIWVVHPDGSIGDEPFLDLTEITTTEGNEQGLVGLEFHPGYGDNGRFFVFLTDLQDAVEILEFRVSETDPDRSQQVPERLVLLVPQPHHYHNGGTMRFDPDGYLFIGLGDGGGIGDPFENGQDKSSLPGTIVRLDVDAADPYGIPETNPFIGDGAPEIWVYGLRNPWRFFIDAPTRTVVVGDVGQGRVEEINLLPLDSAAGSNLGWSVVEGDECYEEYQGPCDLGDYSPPALTYPHSQGCAVVGGPAYRGRRIPGLEGWVVYSDFCFGWLRAFPLLGAAAGDVVELLPQRPEENVTTLAVDFEGEVLVVTNQGTLYRLVPAA